MSRSKIDWLENTGGFSVGETGEQFLQRSNEIAKIRKAICDGKATEADVCDLARLLGVQNDNSSDFSQS